MNSPTLLAAIAVFLIGFTVCPFQAFTLLEVPDDLALAEKARRTLERLRPENPGRAHTFGGRILGDSTIPIRPRGWILCIRRVKRIPGGWRAKVSAQISLGSKLLVLNSHLEWWEWRNGKLTLVAEGVDDLWTPNGGLTGAMM